MKLHITLIFVKKIDAIKLHLIHEYIRNEPSEEKNRKVNEFSFSA